MGLFDKLKKLVSDDSSDTGGIEILPRCQAKSYRSKMYPT